MYITASEWIDILPINVAENQKQSQNSVLEKLCSAELDRFQSKASAMGYFLVKLLIIIPKTARKAHHDHWCFTMNILMGIYFFIASIYWFQFNLNFVLRFFHSEF